MDDRATTNRDTSTAGNRRVGALVPLFNPDDGLPERLARLASQVTQLYLVDDGSTPARRESLRALASARGYRLLEQESNLGIAAAFNRGAAAAIADGCAYVLLVDQDTRPEPHLVSTLVDLFATDGAKAAVIAANYVDAGGRLAYRVPDDRATGEIPVAISSGSMIPATAYQSLGGMDEGLFIDEVDHDFCLRARERGFQILATRQPLTRHEVGRQTLHHLGSLAFSMSHHAPIRRYYMARNRIVVARRHGRQFPGWVAGMLLRSAIEFSLVPLLEKNRRAKTRALARGLIDGLAGRSGRRPTGDR